MGHTPNESSVLQHFERGDALEIHNGIMFDFYPGLPHMGIFNCATPIPMILLLIHGGLESAGTLLFMVLELKN